MTCSSTVYQGSSGLAHLPWVSCAAEHWQLLSDSAVGHTGRQSHWNSQLAGGALDETQPAAALQCLHLSCLPLGLLALEPATYIRHYSPA